MKKTTTPLDPDGGRTRLGRLVRGTLALVVLLAIVGATWYLYETSRPEPLPAPAQAIQSILELRSKSSTDTVEYERYVESTEVAGALAEDAAGKQGQSPIPGWEIPEVVSSSETTASVRVVWKPTDRFPEWPEETIFSLMNIEGLWKIVDAFESASGETTSTP
ncbi:MAG: hypothetical protein RQ731_04605 [Anaerosomatales bacterium]|nr:hypothetical protein [Anaerosomatales bacterium]MDT8434023.1 hypothetical protein [Anaerosomatales bacterium]